MPGAHLMGSELRKVPTVYTPEFALHNITNVLGVSHTLRNLARTTASSPERLSATQLYSSAS